MFIAPVKYTSLVRFDGRSPNEPTGISPFQYAVFPFPVATNTTPTNVLPYIGFNYQGGLIGPRDNGSEIIPLARGSMMFVKSGPNLVADLVLTPPGNELTNSSTWNHVRIDGLTGRARAEHQELR